MESTNSSNSISYYIDKLKNGNKQYKPQTLDDLPTPCFVVKRDQVQRNGQKLLDIAKRMGVELRPHIKTHKTIEAALLQIFGDSIVNATREDFLTRAKITVSTLGEARFYAQHEFQDILYAVPIVQSKLPAAKEIARKIRQFSVLVDSCEGVDQLIAFMESQGDGVKFGVYVDIDNGYHRTGFDPHNDQSIEAVKRLVACPHLVLQGLYTHGGDSYSATNSEEAQKFAAAEAKVIIDFAEKLRSNGIEVKTIAVGSTPTCSNPPASWHGVTEIHPGNYILYDHYQCAIGSCAPNEIAGFVLAQVLSTYKNPNRLLIDAGALALSKDSGPTHLSATGEIEWGIIEGYNNELKLSKVTQELGVAVPRNNQFDCTQIKIGTRLRVIPNHSCLTAACYPKFYVLDETGTITDEWFTAPRDW